MLSPLKFEVSRVDCIMILPLPVMKIFIFFHINALGIKSELAVKYVKVNQGLAFEQNVKGSYTQCYIPNSKFICLLVLKKKILKVFYLLWVRLPSWSCDQNYLNNLFTSHQFLSRCLKMMTDECQSLCSYTADKNI